MTGADLRLRREALGYTQTQMHEQMMLVLGQPRSAYARSIMSRWETGRVGLPVWMDLVVGILEQT